MDGVVDDLLAKAYDPEEFRRQGHILVDLMADHLENMYHHQSSSSSSSSSHNNNNSKNRQENKNDSTQKKVLKYVPPEELYQKWKKDLEWMDSSRSSSRTRQQQEPSPDAANAAAAGQDLKSFFEDILRDMIHLHNPNYLGHQTSVVAPPAALAELFGSLLDPGMGVYEHGTAGVVLERIMAKEMGNLIGWDSSTCDGFFTDGGTLGNLTALLCARQHYHHHQQQQQQQQQQATATTNNNDDDDDTKDIWQNGYQGQQYGFLVSSEAHYSVARDIQIMGMGQQGVIYVPVDDKYRMRTDLLPEYYEKAHEQGITVLGVVSSNCSTATGSHDNIQAIADFCQSHKIWLHVDGAHGGCAMFSNKHRPLTLRGIERADSFTVDFHKMLMTPTLVTAVLFRDGNNSYQTFAQKASYLWDHDADREWYHLGKRTFELTKSFSSIRVYTLWRMYGTALFEQNVDRLYALGKQFARMVQEEDDFEVLLPNPESNVVCFRYVPDHFGGLSEPELEELNASIRELVVKDGEYSMVQTRVSGRLYLRCSLMNPFTTEREMRGLLAKCREMGGKEWFLKYK